MHTTNSILLPNDGSSRVIKHQPWYKERLKEKYLAKDKLKRERIIDPKQWTFIKDGLDDFRDGLPPPHEDLLLKPNKGPSPTIKNDPTKTRVKQSVLSPTSRFTQDQIYFSKRLPMAEAKKQNIEKLIEDLNSHPLSIYDHFEKALPPELYQEVLEILDPDSRGERPLTEHSMMSNLSSKYQDEVNYRKNIRDEVHRLEEKLKESKLEKKEEQKPQRNMYKWIIRKEDAKANKLKSNDADKIKDENIDNHIKEVTAEFCDWIKSLGGEHNIDQVTLTSLFASGYDTKPPLSVPIHVVELSNIPAELRPSAFIPPVAKSDAQSTEKYVFRDSKSTAKGNQQRYGAWYLPREQWQLMSANEKLVDPKLKNDPQKEESKRKVEEMNARLAPLHGSSAFKAFVTQKQPTRAPKLLDELEAWQKEQANKPPPTAATTTGTVATTTTTESES
jgi:hypothetical protein